MARALKATPVDPMTGRVLGPTRVIRKRAPTPAPPAEKPLPAESPLDLDGYPEKGSIADVLAWVQYDPARARAAIVAEHTRSGGTRPTLMPQLQARSQETHR